MQTHFFGAEVTRDFVSGVSLQGSRLKSVVDGVKQQQMAGLLNVAQQIQSLRAAVNNLYRFWPVIMGVQALSEANTKPFICPQQVA